MAKAKTFGVNNFIKKTNKKRPGRHSKKYKKAKIKVTFITVYW